MGPFHPLLRAGFGAKVARRQLVASWQFWTFLDPTRHTIVKRNVFAFSTNFKSSQLFLTHESSKLSELTPGVASWSPVVASWTGDNWRHQLATNWWQTGDQLATNWRQTGDKLVIRFITSWHTDLGNTHFKNWFRHKLWTSKFDLDLFYTRWTVRERLHEISLVFDLITRSVS